jgi:hypothetical protein
MVRDSTRKLVRNLYEVGMWNKELAEALLCSYIGAVQKRKQSLRSAQLIEDFFGKLYMEVYLSSNSDTDKYNYCAMTIPLYDYSPTYMRTTIISFAGRHSYEPACQHLLGVHRTLANLRFCTAAEFSVWKPGVCCWSALDCDLPQHQPT